MEDVQYTRSKAEFIHFKNTLRRSINAAKRLYYMRICALYRNDIKQTWSVIKIHLKRNCTVHHRTNLFSIMLQFQTRVKLLMSLINISLILEGHYQVKFSIYAPARIIYLKPTSHFFFNSVNEECIAKFIVKLKNKSRHGYDSISNKLIKNARHVLTLIVNQSLHTGVYPSQLKLSRVEPLFKHGNKSQLNNYRPFPYCHHYRNQKPCISFAVNST